LSQPPYPPVAGPQGPAAAPPPAAPTQVVFPGQVQLAPQPQYAPTPQQQQPQTFATGFPNYVSPPPSPKNMTGLIVGTVVCLVVLVFAVVGFILVS
jgi:hypothetical protein